MIGIAIPAHEEAHSITAAVRAARCAAQHPALQGEDCAVVVVADACSDDTAAQAHAAGAQVIMLQARNVGQARARAASELLARGARWLAFTDADTRVASDWLVAQLSLKADVVCGTVDVEDWSELGAEGEFLKRHFATSYQDRDEHRHVHGANLALCAQWYARAGGFAPLACSEDVDLVQRLEALGARIAWSALPRVNTSPRLRGRCRGGFADALRRALPAAATLLPGPAPVATLAP